MIVPGEARPALMAMVPHAGYVYSGATAGRVFGAIEVPNRVIVLCPNHTGRGARLSIWAKGEWDTPLGAVPVDEELAGAILEEDSRFTDDSRAHRNEHAIEVELPFLLVKNPEFRLTPIVISHWRTEELVSFGQAIARAVQRVDGPVLIVASTDMSHFVSADEAKAGDDKALKAVVSLDPKQLCDTVLGEGISMCGVMPTAVALAAANSLGASQSELVDYTHSGLVTGDNSSVVAYAGVIIL